MRYKIIYAAIIASCMSACNEKMYDNACQKDMHELKESAGEPSRAIKADTFEVWYYDERGWKVKFSWHGAECEIKESRVI